jgi:hypothetical protein
MGNMSYCRFENTSRDLDDCIQAITNGATDEINQFEVQGLRGLLIGAKQILDMKGEIQRAVAEAVNK